MTLTLYRWLSPLLARLLPLAAVFSPKLAATLRWRREQRPDVEHLRSLADRRPRYWIHAASAGELEQARPLLAGLRERHPESAILLTLGSASARRAAASVAEADCVLPLPADTPRAMAALLEAFAPEILVFVKWDVWPNLLLEARRRRRPVLLLGAALAPESGRMRWPGRLLAAPLHRRLSGVGAASEADAKQFRALGVEEGKLHLTGDTRFDRVLARRRERRPQPLVGEGRDRRGCLVAGSTWEAEEEMILAAFAALRNEGRALRVLLAPHEPTPANLGRLADAAQRRDLPLWRLSERSQLADGGLCVVDRLGILAELYALGELSLVGGGFGAGVHSVLEPAAHGCPVLMGPRLGRADEARRLVAAGGARIFRDAAELEAHWRGYLDDADTLARDQGQALQFVESGEGSVERSLSFIESHRGELKP